MPDLSESLLPSLKSHRLPGLDLADGFVYPHYEGQSVLNLPSTLCRWLGTPPLGRLGVSPQILAPVGEGGVRRIVFILMDALSLARLRLWMRRAAPVWRRLAEGGVLAPLTSITPSTTTAALTSLWTGQSAAEHGVAGYELWLKEYGVVANMILHTPISFQNDAGSLAKAGFQPASFLNGITLGAHLSAHGVKAYAFQHHSIIRSGLSQMFFKEVTTQSFGSAADLWVNVRYLLEEQTGERLYVWVYWGEVDHLSHFYGPDNERAEAEFAAFSAAFERLFLSRLSPAARSETLVVLTADHGQIHTRKDPRYDLRNHPAFTRLLHLLPTGENRMAYLFVRPGQMDAVREYVEKTWPGEFALLEPLAAVQSGLFGPGAPHPRLLDRLGDLLVIAKGNAYWWWADKDNPLLGRHGGLSAEEMVVPLLAARL